MARKAIGLITTAAMTLAIGIAATGAANAAGPGGNETCPAGSFCLYYNSSEYGWGAFENFTPGSFPDLSDYHFSHYRGLNGYGLPLNDQVAAIVNNTNSDWKLCTAHTTNEGTCQVFTPGDSGDVLPDLKNEDVSLWAL